MDPHDKLLLREFDAKVLQEFDFGGEAMGGGWGGAGSGGPYGMGGTVVSGDLAYKAFIQPFVNVFKTAKAGGKAMLAHSEAVITTIVTGLFDTLIPSYEANYDKIIQKRNNTLGQVEKEYAPVYRSITECLKNKDFLATAFMYDPSSFFETTIKNPHLFMTIWGGVKAPKLFGNLLSLLSGGRVDPYLAKVKQFITSDTMTEDDKSSAKISVANDKQKSEKLIKLLLKPEAIKLALQGEVMKSMQAAARNSVNSMLDEVISVVKKTMKLNDIKSLQAITGERIPELADLDKLDDAERKTTEQNILKGLKSSVKRLYIDKLTKEMKELIDNGVPRDHEMIKAYQEAVKQLKSL